MQVLDLRTLPCPQPVIECRKLLSEKNISAIKILVDNNAAVENVSRYLDQQSFTVTSSTQGSDFCIEAIRGDGQIVQDNNANITNNADTKSIVVFITTESLGRGDDVLGHKLMATFISTLPELGESLWRLILLNGGVKLATKNNPALEKLQELERAGIKILVCGTCLAHYELEKQVGETSNMLDIVTSLQAADSVIRP